jgi:hypothetical protein
MAGSKSPRLVEILIRLAQSWWSIYGDRYDRMHERLSRVADLDGHPELKAEVDALDAEFESHPFRGFVRLVREETGEKFSTLCDAARQEFDGRQKIVTTLDALDANRTTPILLAKLYDRWPDVAASLFGETAPTPPESLNDAPTDHTSTDTKPKRRGRPKVDCETIEREAQLVADWERARDHGTYKGDFVNDRHMTTKELDKLLDRVRKRKCASE